MNCATRQRTRTLCDHPLLIAEILRRIASRQQRRDRWKTRFQLRRQRFVRWINTPLGRQKSTPY